MSETFIHPTAIIHPGAEIGTGVQIGPFSVIGPETKIGDGTWIDSHVVVSQRTTIGKNNKIWRFASVGTEPQDLKFKGEKASLEIGDGNMIREYVNISIGTEGGGMLTKVGSRSLFMVNVHIGHDCQVGDDCVFANGVSLAGHVEVGHRAVLGGHSAVHQFCKLGGATMVAGGAIVVQDVPPFVLVHGNHAEPNGLNLTGLRRLGFDSKKIGELKEMYRLVYRANLTLDDAVTSIKASVADSPEKQIWLDFISQSKRGLAR